MDVVVFYYFLESRDINAALLRVLLPLNSLISNWFTWRLSHQAPGIHPGQATGHSQGEVEHAGLHMERSGNQTQNLCTWPPGCKNWDKQENHTILQHAKVVLSEILIQSFIVLLGSVPSGVTHLSSNNSLIRSRFSPFSLTLEFSTSRAPSAITVYWKYLRDFWKCEIMCSASTATMEEKAQQPAGGPAGC